MTTLGWLTYVVNWPMKCAEDGRDLPHPFVLISELDHELPENVERYFTKTIWNLISASV